MGAKLLVRTVPICVFVGFYGFAVRGYDRILFQLGAIYRAVRTTRQGVTPAGAPVFERRAASFAFPAIFDYYFSKAQRRPYAGLGMVAAHIVTGTIESQAAGPSPAGAPFEGQFFLKHQLPAYV